MADLSFSDIRSAVRTALAAEDKDKGDDLIIDDIGSDWVVYEDPDTDGPGMCRRSYRMDGGKVVLTSAPVKVSRVTTYEPVDGPKNLRDAAKVARVALADRRNAAAGKPTEAY